MAPILVFNHARCVVNTRIRVNAKGSGLMRPSQMIYHVNTYVILRHPIPSLP